MDFQATKNRVSAAREVTAEALAKQLSADEVVIVLSGAGAVDALFDWIG